MGEGPSQGSTVEKVCAVKGDNEHIQADTIQSLGQQTQQPVSSPASGQYSPPTAVSQQPHGARGNHQVLNNTPIDWEQIK